MGAGATMGSCIRCLPFHPKEGVGPKSITVTSEMAKHNRRVFLCDLSYYIYIILQVDMV